MARSKESIHIGVGGHVVAIDAKTGDEIWRTKLKGASFVSLAMAAAAAAQAAAAAGAASAAT